MLSSEILVPYPPAKMTVFIYPPSMIVYHYLQFAHNIYNIPGTRRCKVKKLTSLLGDVRLCLFFLPLSIQGLVSGASLFYLGHLFGALLIRIPADKLVPFSRRVL